MRSLRCNIPFLGLHCYMLAYLQMLLSAAGTEVGGVLVHWMRELSRIGVADDLPEREAKHIVVLNVIALFIFIIGIPNMLFTAANLPAALVLLICQACHLVAMGLALFWNRQRKHLTARIWFSVFVALFLTLYTFLLGTESRFQLFLVIQVFVVFYIFPAKEHIWMYAMSGVSSACFVATELLLRDGGLLSGIPEKYILVQNYFNTIGFVLCALSMGGFGYLTLSNAEERLARDNDVIQDKTRQLEIANKHKSHFLASASHDLRQPLHALNLFVAQLQGEADPAERSRLVGLIDAAVSSMNELFEALLDMTKLDAGILQPSLSEFPVKRLLDRIKTTFADAARKKGLRLHLVGSGAWVSSDSILLERILLNLVSNAVRYTERGGVVVGCRHRGNELRIDVCDTGPGIPEDQRRNIFGEFYQLASASVDRQSGLGLGLAIVDRLGRLLGHAVELESRPGRGSRFSIRVPRVAQPHAATERTSSLLVAEVARGKRVIVIDDDTLVLDGMRGILQRWGCQVRTAASGAAALASLGQDGGPPDLIISDYRLGDGETGIEAIERLRQAIGSPVPAFMISGDTAPERLREASARGFQLLHKPVSPMALRTTLNRLLKAQAALRQAV